MHTEMFTEAVIPLIEKGILNGRKKTLLTGKIVTSFCFGTRKLYDYIHDNPQFEFRNCVALLRCVRVLTTNAKTKIEFQ